MHLVIWFSQSFSNDYVVAFLECVYFFLSFFSDRKRPQIYSHCYVKCIVDKCANFFHCLLFFFVFGVCSFRMLFERVYSYVCVIVNFQDAMTTFGSFHTLSTILLHAFVATEIYFLFANSKRRNKKKWDTRNAPESDSENPVFYRLLRIIFHFVFRIAGWSVMWMCCTCIVGQVVSFLKFTSKWIFFCVSWSTCCCSVKVLLLLLYLLWSVGELFFTQTCMLIQTK